MRQVLAYEPGSGEFTGILTPTSLPPLFVHRRRTKSVGVNEHTVGHGHGRLWPECNDSGRKYTLAKDASQHATPRYSQRRETRVTIR